MKIAWTIAASDSSSGAGIQADLTTFNHFKIHGASIITKITAQNTSKIIDSYTLPDQIFKAQLNCLAYDLIPDAIKLSVLGSVSQLDILIEYLEKFNVPIIYDPVFKSTSDHTLTSEHLVDRICNKLFPYLTLITPNINEAEQLTKIKIKNKEDIINAAKILLAMGIKNVLIKGGHLLTDVASDYFSNSKEGYWILSQRQNLSMHVHGTGCHLSSAITANLSLGHTLNDALIIAKSYINRSIRTSYLPNQTSKQLYISSIQSQIQHSDFPYLIKSHLDISNFFKSNQAIPCGNLGLYPIVDNKKWVLKLIEYGVKTIQLRIKSSNLELIEDEIIQSIKIAKMHNDIKLFINDYWEFAIKHKAYGVHLGQDDLKFADINAIKQNNLCLGISTHNYHELAYAMSHKPSYIALGPIYPTTTKIMQHNPQGIEKIHIWQELINCPLVLIGGINLDNIDKILKTGIKNIAVISAITEASDPETRTKILLKKISNYV